jgi:hypothetical protein
VKILVEISTFLPAKNIRFHFLAEFELSQDRTKQLIRLFPVTAVTQDTDCCLSLDLGFLFASTIHPTQYRNLTMPKTKSKLKLALEEFKGVDHKLDRQKKLQKQAEKRKRSKAQAEEEDEEVDEKTNGHANGHEIEEDADSAAEELDAESDEEDGGAPVRSH